MLTTPEAPALPKESMQSMGEAATEVRTINLALQGGGAHGAFTWGVLDRLLEDERIGFEGVSATSAGAMNAAVMAYGMAEGGREGARKALASFWRRIAHAAVFSPLQPSPMDRLLHNHHLDYSPVFQMFELMTRLWSPYEMNPTNFNPLRHVLEQSVDFERLRERCPLKLFLSATNVRSGKVRVFETKEITPDAVLASACLPFMFQAVEIEGEAYWDGGYMGNPALFPLIYGCESRDVVVVHINPLRRDDLPKNASEILNRINEISFNSSLFREMRAIAFVSRLIDDGAVQEGRLKRMLIHSIEAQEVMQGLSVLSKLNADWEFLTHLFSDGREYADRWLEQNFAAVGVRSSVDVQGIYL
ncbi:MAG: patatin-like phospholipase family protein [Geminicoccaceae bacterium]